MRTRERGLTLVEILLSMLVFVVGIVGVMALFPTALHTSQQSIEEQRGAMLAESVKNMLSQALRTPVDANTDGISDVDGSGRPLRQFTYDFWIDNGSGGANDSIRYGENGVFPLPRLQDGWMRHPGNVAAASDAGTLGITQVFTLGGDAWLVGSSEWVINQNDPSENYPRWAFAFDVRKANTMPWETNLTVSDPQIRLYEFNIYIYRRRPSTTSTGGGGTGSTTSTTWENRLVLRVSDRISASN